MWNHARTLLATSAIVACSFAASEAAANCATPEPQLQGTVPADGATDVPLDTAFVFFAALQPLEVILNDVALARDGEVWRAAQALEPETNYELNIKFPHPNGHDGGDLVTQTFTTGTDLAAGTAPPKPAIASDEEDEYNSWNACERYANSVGCPDENDPAWVRFETEPSSAVGWIIRADDSHPEFDSLWPASCSNEIVWRGYARNDCFNVTAIDSVGRLSEPTEYCVQNVDLRPWEQNPSTPDAGMDADAGDPEEDSGSSSSSCSAASGPISSPFWLALFGLLVLRRRSRQARPRASAGCGSALR